MTICEGPLQFIRTPNRGILQLTFVWSRAFKCKCMVLKPSLLTLGINSMLDLTLFVCKHMIGDLMHQSVSMGFKVCWQMV